jgi:hypothetical protein
VRCIYGSMFEYCVLENQPTQSWFIFSCFGEYFSNLEKFPGELHIFILNILSQENKSQLFTLSCTQQMKDLH